MISEKSLLPGFNESEEKKSAKEIEALDIGAKQRAEAILVIADLKPATEIDVF